MKTLTWETAMKEGKKDVLDLIRYKIATTKDELVNKEMILTLIDFLLKQNK